jgi:hypothetical protein
MARHLADPDPDAYNDDADIDEAPRAAFEARGFGLVDPPTNPVPAQAHVNAQQRMRHEVVDNG